MPDTLDLIFKHCCAWEEVNDAKSFYTFIKQGQIETTMPFNDYWAYEPKLRSPLWDIGAAAFGIAALAVWAGWSGLWGGSILGLVLWTLLLILLAAIAIVWRKGTTPFPAAPDSDLASILKALYIQQKFTGFMIANLGNTDEEGLAQAFDDFCTIHKPTEVQGPSQPPGVLKTDWGKGT